jgi:hypothetical protein
MKIQVTSIEEPGEDDGKDLPVVHFKGMSRSMHASWDPNANSKLLGSVRMTRNGDVRWTTLSIFHGLVAPISSFHVGHFFYPYLPIYTTQLRK